MHSLPVAGWLLMGVAITGMVTGEERKNGTMDDGTPWSKHVLVLLDGTRTREVRLDKGFQGPIPARGDEVAIACSFGYGNKLIGLHRLPNELVPLIEQAPATAGAK